RRGDPAIAANVITVLTASTATVRKRRGRPHRVLSADDAHSEAWSLLFGLASSEPGSGEQLADLAGRPVGGDRLLAFTKPDLHEHLPLPIEHYQEQVRDRLFPDLTLPPGQKLAASGPR